MEGTYRTCIEDRKGKYVLAEYEKIKRITMPLGNHHVLYMTTEVEADDRGIIDKVRRLNL